VARGCQPGHGKKQESSEQKVLTALLAHVANELPALGQRKIDEAEDQREKEESHYGVPAELVGITTIATITCHCIKALLGPESCV